MTIAAHLGAQLARYRETHDLPDAPAAELLQLTERDQHKAWLSRHLSRCEAAEILDPYGLEVQSLLTAERLRVTFENGASILVMSRSGGALPTISDWQLSAFAATGGEAFYAMSGGKLDLRHAIEAARSEVDPGLELPCGVPQ